MSLFNEIYGELKRRARARLDLHRREKPNDVLLIAAVIQLALMIAMVVVAPFDLRLVSGVNPWFKPIKFTQSIAAYLLTVAWMLDYLRVSRRGKQIISWGIAICVVAQIACITLQAARGTTSHFNQSSPFDIVITVLLGNCAAGVFLSGEIRGRPTNSVGDCHRAADFSGGICHRGSDGL
jgi:hypothetical protein